LQRERNQEEGRKKYNVCGFKKAAFDKVNRDKLWETFRGKSVNEYLVKKIEKMYEEMEVR